ncbi:hypothetical protein ERO13_D02G143901v2 [Gossypium hirsutum]|uniref:Uncharacterized protein n=2 Tax=Gossypium TaxID=3633 RepID=A0A5D2VXU6_GOSMU|nr:hypothetical protein ERO13_D02G143901v2 [Gossypium hirsutum]TYG79948.1 hypothetical protein ES288_D02G178000v1 [Gossypium darwinii]TYI93956.1 hypothetical protein E1A91_D02G170900v1 [Gossypium mustelinum]TYI93957.1 hypothetical protein E1A91_D02G170900v1 [Gossypium mustelinum]
MIMKEVVPRTQNTFGVQHLALQFVEVTLTSVLRKVRIVRQWVLFQRSDCVDCCLEGNPQT